MVTKKGDIVEIKVTMQELEKSIALLEDLKRYCDEERSEEGAKETSLALQVAIHAMQMVWILIDRGALTGEENDDVSGQEPHSDKVSGANLASGNQHTATESGKE